MVAIEVLIQLCFHVKVMIQVDLPEESSFSDPFYTRDPLIDMALQQVAYLLSRGVSMGPRVRERYFVLLTDSC